MKKTMLAAALAALAIGSASADTIYITGSTAFRKAANTAINDALTTGGATGTLVARDAADWGAGNVVWKADNSNTNFVVVYWSGSEAGIQSVAGPDSVTLKAPYNVLSTNKTVYTNVVKPTGLGGTWSGVAGNWTNSKVVTNVVSDAIASQPNKLSFWDPTQTFTADTNKLASGTIAKVSAVAQIAFSDTYQASSAFGGGRTVAFFGTNNIDPTVTNAGTVGIKVAAQRSVICASNTYSTITNDIQVGIVGFGFVTSANAVLKNGGSFDGTNTGIANITKTQAADLFKKGKVNAAQFTGSLDDTNRFVYAIGRSIDSGTRLVTFSMLGLGSTVTNNSLTNGVNSGINQYLILGTNTGVKYSTYSYSDGALGVYASNSGSTLVITNWPAEVTVGKLCATGHNGYASGGDLCTTIAAVASTNSPGNAIAIGYAGLADAQGKGANIIAYEGIYPSTGAIKSGSYPFWSIEHILVKNGVADNVNSLASAVATAIQTNSTATLQGLGKGTVRLSDVINGTNQLTRSTDGSAIVKNWTNTVVLTNLPSYYNSSKQSSAGAGAGF
jgi:hypothetical protein